MGADARFAEVKEVPADDRVLQQHRNQETEDPRGRPEEERVADGHADRLPEVSVAEQVEVVLEPDEGWRGEEVVGGEADDEGVDRWEKVEGDEQEDDGKREQQAGGLVGRGTTPSRKRQPEQL